MTRQFQFTIRVLLVIVLMVASFLAGMAVIQREASDLRSALKIEQESHHKAEIVMRGVATELIEAKSRIRELEGK